MIDIDWNLIGTLNGWQSVLTIAVIIIAIFIIARFLMRFWPWLRKVISFTDAGTRIVGMADVIDQLPAFIDRTDKAIEEIRHEVAFNNGSSVKDAIARVETGVSGLHKKYDELTAADLKLSKKLEQTQPQGPRTRRPQQKKEQS